MYTSTRHLHGTKVPAPSKPLHHRQVPRHRLLVPAAASYCPYRTLGVSEAADEKEIKTAFRKLALRYHPDTSTAADAEAKFISIQEAYNILTGKSRGKEVGPQNPSSSGAWDFHDWYWQFRMSRTWDKQRSGGPKPPAYAAGHSQPEAKEEIRTQLAGLRHRAAIRKVQEQNAATASASDDDSDSAHESTSQASDAQAEEFIEAADLADGANYTAEAATEDWQHQRPKFVATESRRAQVTSQLTGLKRKSKLKQQSVVGC